jgi:hypothetical protein
MVQASEVMEIKGSPVKLAGALPLGVLMTALSAASASGWIPSDPTGVAISWFCLVFFAVSTAVVAWRLLRVGQTVLTITPHGIKDIYFAADVVPWSAVRNVTTAEVGWQKVIVLTLDPSIEQQLALTLAAKWFRGPNRMLGVDGLCVSAIGLKIDHDTLFKACAAHWRAASGAR